MKQHHVLNSGEERKMKGEKADVLIDKEVENETQ